MRFLKAMVLFISFSFLCGLLWHNPATPLNAVTGGTIKGFVYLVDDSRIPGGLITLTSDVTGRRTTISDEDGTYKFDGLPPGDFNIRFELEGFKIKEKKCIALTLGQTKTVNILTETTTLKGTNTIVIPENFGIVPGKPAPVKGEESSFYYAKKKLFAKHGAAPVMDLYRYHPLYKITHIPFKADAYIKTGLDIKKGGVYVLRVVHKAGKDKKKMLLFLKIKEISNKNISVEYYFH